MMSPKSPLSVWSRAGFLALILGCGGERDRPGPPSILIEVPPGSTVMSPDTLPMAVIAQDPNGLDSVTVSFLDSTVSINTGLNSEVTALLNWPVPGGIAEGTMLTITARARDLVGQLASETTSVTVVDAPSSGGSLRR